MGAFQQFCVLPLLEWCIVSLVVGVPTSFIVLFIWLKNNRSAFIISFVNILYGITGYRMVGLFRLGKTNLSREIDVLEFYRERMH